MAIQVQLEDDEALVLFELLSSGMLSSSSDPAEAHALSVVLARLEEQLTAPFDADYADQVAAAKNALVARYGQ
ncbi:hypothetical protein [Luteimonas sp. J29]|jgi:hypothetical protein|uniref:hypothetical protein n=1 Tax=Luteimonas sp. J29 TaxID=935863 RepID=UPI0012EC3826|nr:hypothetical protein [Luteimonas sp. J29]